MTHVFHQVIDGSLAPSSGLPPRLGGIAGQRSTHVRMNQPTNQPETAHGTTLPQAFKDALILPFICLRNASNLARPPPHVLIIAHTIYIRDDSHSMLGSFVRFFLDSVKFIGGDLY